MVCASSVCMPSICLKASSVDEADVGPDDDNVDKAVCTSVKVVVDGTVTACTWYWLLDGCVICATCSVDGMSM